jgi:hypothetical protein
MAYTWASPTRPRLMAFIAFVSWAPGPTMLSPLLVAGTRSGQARTFRRAAVIAISASTPVRE